MSETKTTEPAKKEPKLSRKTLKKKARAKKIAKLKDPAVAKVYFEAKSKRSTEKKSAYRKKKNRKK